VQAIAFVDHAIQASPYFRSVSSVFISGEISVFLIDHPITRDHPIYTLRVSAPPW
jgi:hypothetical protein